MGILCQEMDEQIIEGVLKRAMNDMEETLQQLINEENDHLTQFLAQIKAIEFHH